MDTNISIILPTYNGASRISRAIESVIAQSYTDWELLVIDDGSTDTTREVVEVFVLRDTRIRYIKNEHNLGIQKTLNQGLHIAQGDYIARIDDDDVWSDTSKLQKQVEFLTSHSDYVLVGTGAILVDTEGKELGRYLLPDSDIRIRERLLGKNCFAHPSIMMRTQAVREVGGYNEKEESRYIEDYELWLRLGCVGKMANLPTYSAILMVHAGSITAKYRVLQAKRIMKLSWKYRKEYPHALKNILLATARYVFFVIQSIVPIPRSILYKIQSLQRSI